MRKVPLIPILVIILLVAGGFLAYWVLTPRLLSVSPPDHANAVPAGMSLQLEFTRPMRTDEVLARLNIQPMIQGEFSWQDNTLVFTPEKPWQSGETVKITLEPGAHYAGGLSLPMRASASWSFTITQPRLAYLYPYNSPADIYLLNPYSGESQRLTNSSGGVDSFSVDTSGKAIYFSARDAQGNSAIYRLDVHQGWQTQDQSEVPETHEFSETTLVLECPQAACRDPVISPKGDYLAYERAAFLNNSTPDYPQVWMIALDPEGTPSPDTVPILAGPELHQTIDPSWSSQGLLAYYDSDGLAFTFIDPVLGVQAHFPNQTGQPGDWHPNGQEFLAPEINFLGENTSPDLDNLQPLANSHLILFNLEGGESQSLTLQEDLEDTAPSFSPDGAYLAFARKSLHRDSWTPGRQLWIMRTGTWQAEALTDDAIYNHFAFAWSPPGDMLSYVRFNQSALSEPPELWVMDPFSGQATQLVVGGHSPQWIP